MRNRIAWAASLPMLLLLGAVPAPRPAPVAYTLAPVIGKDGIEALSVTISFSADPSGRTILDWEDSWAGQDKLAQWSRDMRVTGARVAGPAPHGGVVLRSAAGARITASYRVVSAYAADPDVDNSDQPNPVIRPGWFYAVGDALFAFPHNQDSRPASFRWLGPPGIRFASDLEHRIGGSGSGPRRVSDIVESVVIGGRDLRIAKTSVGGSTVRVASLGDYRFDQAAFDTLAEKVVAAERGFWRDKRDLPFLITLAPLESKPGRLSYGGTGRSDAFALWVDRSAPLANLAWLLAHEYFHTWNSRQLGRMGEGEAEPRDYWMSEGFTDFYARRLMLRAGLITPQQFVDSWNEAIASYAASPFHTTPNVTVAAQFWKDRDAERLPYQRGALLAALWDARLRTQSGGRTSLDAVLIDQRDRVARMRGKPPLLTELFVRVAIAHGLDVAADIARFVERGEAIFLPEDAFGTCARVVTSERAIFSRGFDAAATVKGDNIVTGVDPASPAYAAGLRDGMKLLRRTGGTNGDSTVPYVLRVSDGGTEREIRYLPEGKDRITQQVIVLDKAKFAATPDLCRASLAG